MGRHHRPTRLFRPALILMAVLCVALATPLMAQQTADSTRAAATTIAAPASTHATTAPAPQASERFGRIGPSTTSHHRAVAAAAFGGEGGSHTIVISTLALVLIVIIVVLLIR